MPETIRRTRGQCYSWGLAGAAAAGSGLGAGTRNIVWQYWHFTSFPRTSEETERILRHLRLGQSNWTDICFSSDFIVPWLGPLEPKRIAPERQRWRARRLRPVISWR